jgi:26S proteasome regulatory subunit N6
LHRCLLGYSYIFEAFESLSSRGKDGALGALNYMLLCEVTVMLNLLSQQYVFFFSCCISYQPEDVNSLLKIKLALKYAQAQLRDVGYEGIARAHQN